MKILRITTFLDYGGIETKMVNLSTIKDENEWVFCSIGHGGRAEKKIKANNKRVICLSLKHKIPNLLTLWEVYRFILKEKPNVIHTAGAEANFYGFFGGKLAGVKNIIVEEIGISHPSKFAKTVFKYIYSNAKYTIGESKVVVNNLDQLFNIKSKKLKVIHNFGVFGLSSFTRSISDQYFHIVMISRLEPVKNISGAIRVIKRLVDNNIKVKLTIAGRGTLKDELENLIHELKLSEYINLVGFIDNPYPYLLSSNLYLLNSYSEGFSNSLIESMYSKTPSLSTMVGSANEVIKDNFNGFLIPVGDNDHLYYKIIEILNKPKIEMEKIGENAHKTIIKNYSINQHINQLMSIYKK